jgi:hypothetical protein
MDNKELFLLILFSFFMGALFSIAIVIPALLFYNYFGLFGGIVGIFGGIIFDIIFWIVLSLSLQ